MATKKAGSTGKNTTKTKVVSAPSKPTTTSTKVTTVQAVAAEQPKATSRFDGNRTYVASALIAEFIGTFLLTVAFIGTKGDPLYLGFVLAGIVLIVGTISGAHINPAITVGTWVTRKISGLRALGYIIAQVLGAVLALVALTAFIGAAPAPDAQSAMMGGQSAAPELFKVAALTDSSHWYVLFAELIGATIFAFAVASARKEKLDRVAKAFTIGFGLLIAGVFTTIVAGYASANGVFNPAIALSVGAIDWGKIDWFAIAAYLVAPLLGGIIGFALRDVLSVGEKNV
ncbi:MAG: hypothetical protein EOO17_03890 [Chloroflexi bacterium]|nr:MAG: hypothetical protein EOO17_03890 [Chloroflexota bacterium]